MGQFIDKQIECRESVLTELDTKIGKMYYKIKPIIDEVINTCGNESFEIYDSYCNFFGAFLCDRENLMENLPQILESLCNAETPQALSDLTSELNYFAGGFKIYWNKSFDKMLEEVNFDIIARNFVLNLSKPLFKDSKKAYDDFRHSIIGEWHIWRAQEEDWFEK